MVATKQIKTRPPHCEHLIERFSSLHKLKKATAIVIRFARNLIHKYKPHIVDTRLTGHITMHERIEALHHLIRHEQQVHFASEIEACKSNTLLKKSGSPECDQSKRGLIESLVTSYSRPKKCVPFLLRLVDF